MNRFEAVDALGKGEQTRHRIVRAAIRQFGETGYRQTSIASVARASGLTPAAVYPYFATKDELFRGAVNSDVEGWITAARVHIASSPNPWVAQSVQLMRSVRSHTLVWRLLSEESASIVALCLDLPAVEAIRTDLAHDLAAAQSVGLLPATIDAVETSAALQATFLAFVVLQARTGLPDLERHLETLGCLIVAALE